jgi:hypothetical protein
LSNGDNSFLTALEKKFGERVELKLKQGFYKEKETVESYKQKTLKKIIREENLYECILKIKQKDKGKPQGDFDRLVFVIMLEIAIDNSRRNDVLFFLSKYCPDRRREYPLMIESYLAGSRLENPMALLIEAYKSKNTDAAAKQNILASLKRAFYSQFDKMQSDEVFIEKCEKWLLKHYPNVHINRNYPWLPARSALYRYREKWEHDVYNTDEQIRELSQRERKPKRQKR